MDYTLDYRMLVLAELRKKTVMFVYYSDICAHNRSFEIAWELWFNRPHLTACQDDLNSEGVKPVYFLNTLLKYCGLSP